MLVYSLQSVQTDFVYLDYPPSVQNKLSFEFEFDGDDEVEIF